MNQEELVTAILNLLSSYNGNQLSSDKEKKILDFINQLSIISIRELILKASTIQQLNYLLSTIIQNASSTSIESCQFVVLKATVEVLCTVYFNATDNEISELTQSICIELDDLTGNEVASILNVFLQYYDFEGQKTSGRSEKQMQIVLDLLPKLLSLCTSTTIIIDSDIEGGGVCMNEFRNHAIQRIIDRNWNDSTICSIISCLRECSLTDDMIIAVVNKISNLLSKIKDNAIASIIYQILLLTNVNVSRVVLVSILLNIRKKCNCSQLPAIINHFSFALRNNVNLCKVFMELMKSSLLPFSTISICVLLSLSDNEKYRQSVYSILLNELQLEYEQTYYSWRYSLLSSIPQDSKYKPISKLLQDIIDIVNAGYIEGIELLLHFYDYLLHYNGKWDNLEREWFYSYSRSNIISLFNQIPSARQSVMSLIVNEINRKEVNDSYFILLNSLCSSSLSFILSSITSIKTLVSHIPLMDSDVVPSLIQSIHTIIPSRPDLFDILIIILKKCCYQSDENIRMSGVSGLIELLCKSTTLSNTSESFTNPSISLTQIGTDSMQVAPNIIPQTTVEDALNLIHRYSNTIHATQSNYYLRFYSLLLKLYNDSPVARSGILQLFIEKLKSLLDGMKSTQPSQLASCLNLDVNCMNGSIQQPIHELIAVTALILHPVHPVPLVGTDERRFQELSSLVDQFVEQLIHSEVEEFHLDKSCSFNINENDGKTNCCKRQILITFYLVVIYIRTVGISHIEGNGNAENAMRVLMIGQITMMLNNITKLNKIAGDKGKDPYYQKVFESIIARPAIIQLLQLLVNMRQSTQDSELLKAINNILDDSSILQFITNSIHQIMKCFSSSILHKRENTDFCFFVRDVCKYCFKLHQIYFMEEHANYSIFCTALLNVLPEAFSILTSSFYLRFYPLDLDENASIFVVKEAICKDLLLTNTDLSLQDILTTIQSFLSSKQLKLGSILLEFIQLFIDTFNVESSEIAQLIKWLESYLNSPEVPSGFVSTLISCYCQCTLRFSQPIQLFIPITSRIHALLSMEASSTSSFSSINTENCAAVICSIMSSLQSFFKPLQFLFQQCKWYQVKNEVEQDRISHLVPAFFVNWKKKSMLLCTTLTSLAQILQSLLQCEMKVTAGEALLTYLKGYYDIVNHTVKEIANGGELCPLQSLSQLVQTISELLTPLIYNLIHTIQKPGDKESHIKKQAKLIPEVIYAIEQYEAGLVQVNKKTKGNVNLTMYVRRSTARDFRIDMEKLNKKMERRDEPEEENSKRRKVK